MRSEDGEGWTAEPHGKGHSAAQCGRLDGVINAQELHQLLAMVSVRCLSQAEGRSLLLDLCSNERAYASGCELGMLLKSEGTASRRSDGRRTDVHVLWLMGPFPAPASVWRLQVPRPSHSASRRLPGPDRCLVA